MVVLRPMEQYIGAKALKLLTGDKYFGNVANEVYRIIFWFDVVLQ